MTSTAASIARSLAHGESVVVIVPNRDIAVAQMNDILRDLASGSNAQVVRCRAGERMDLLGGGRLDFFTPQQKTAGRGRRIDRLEGAHLLDANGQAAWLVAVQDG